MSLRTVDAHLVLVFIKDPRRCAQQCSYVLDCGAESQLLDARMAPRLQHLRRSLAYYGQFDAEGAAVSADRLQGLQVRVREEAGNRQ